jgi:hypothetical protein
MTNGNYALQSPGQLGDIDDPRRAYFAYLWRQVRTQRRYLHEVVHFLHQLELRLNAANCSSADHAFIIQLRETLTMDEAKLRADINQMVRRLNQIDCGQPENEPAGRAERAKASGS